MTDIPESSPESCVVANAMEMVMVEFVLVENVSIRLRFLSCCWSYMCASGWV